MDFRQKYLKYKNKYLTLKNQKGGINYYDTRDIIKNIKLIIKYIEQKAEIININNTDYIIWYNSKYEQLCIQKKEDFDNSNYNNKICIKINNDNLEIIEGNWQTATPQTVIPKHWKDILDNIENYVKINISNEGKIILNLNLKKAELYDSIMMFLGKPDTNFLFQNKKKITFDELIINSDNFNKDICAFPKTTKKYMLQDIEHRIKDIVARESNNDQIKKEITEFANSVYSIMHNNVKKLIKNFLVYKKISGSDIEKKFYNEQFNYSDDENIQKFINRLLTQRPLAFLSRGDSYKLRHKDPSGNNITGEGDYIFDNIGTDKESKIVKLENYISYDEMQISALLGVAVPTLFINKGSRGNLGIYNPKNEYTKKGIYVGLVGARFEREELMEYQHILITETQNSTEKGYGLSNNTYSKLSIWEQFYGEKFPTYEEAQKDTAKYIRLKIEYTDIYTNEYFNASIYKKRINISILPFLMHANNIALEKGKNAYCRVVGLGLGVWAVDSKLQQKLMLEVYRDILNEFEFTNISSIEFLYIDEISNMFNDLIKNKTPFKNLNYDITMISVDPNNNKIVISNDDVPIRLAVGDYVCQAEEAPFAQIPAELHSMLAQRVACRCLEALNDTQGLAVANAKLQEMETRASTMIQSRVESAPIKVVNKHGFLNYRRRTPYGGI